MNYECVCVNAIPSVLWASAAISHTTISRFLQTRAGALPSVGMDTPSRHDARDGAEEGDEGGRRDPDGFVSANSDEGDGEY